jgi:choline monooxygenase
MWLWDREGLRARVERAVAAKVGDLAPTATTVATSVYLDPARRDAERRSMRASARPLVALGDLAPKGFTPARLGDAAFLVGAQPDGTHRVFHARCLHRGAEVACERGAALAACPYHGWGYDASGALRHVYGRDHGVDVDALRLAAHPSFVAGGFLWLAPEPDAGPAMTPASLVAEVAAAIATFHAWTTPRVHREFTLEGAFDWKIGVEAFLETYHFASAHQRTLGHIGVKNVALYDGGPGLARFTVPWRAPEPTDADVRDGCHFMYFFFPGTFFLVFPDHFGWLTIAPAGPGRTTLRYRGLAPHAHADEALLAKVAGSVAFLEGVKTEDVALCHAIQRGLQPGGWHQITRFEPGVAAFHEHLARTLECSPA